MKTLLLTAAMLYAYGATGQGSRWELCAQALPELTKYYGRYLATPEDPKFSVNPGVGVGARYRVHGRVFLSAGIAYIPRTFHTKVSFNEAAIPGITGPVNNMAKWTRQITYRNISLPVEINSYLWKARRIHPYLCVGLSANYILNASYTTNESSLDGTYAKNQLLGVAITAGGGIDYRISSRLAGLASVRIAGLNVVRNDQFLFNGNEFQALLHNYLTLGLGLAYRL